MRVEWTPLAKRHRDDIWLYIAKDNPQAACDLDERISAAVGRLRTFPDSGRPSLVPHTRETYPTRTIASFIASLTGSF